ncbi:hypothetical protein HPB47_023986 [Ixodes persulcatus]|uniref:Uncharacterized protein n=1 Tax=Ixodes persulcatus TaxID=34615 RepID=A0AC60Q5W9_IXOPE|nr:hypothetical protein HPB47_023986 [Ixodes persulcatus]
MLSLTAVVPKPASAGVFPADADLEEVAEKLTGGDEEAALLTMMNEYMEIWYVNGESGEIVRDTAELTHHTDSDTVTFAATEATSEVTLVDFRGYKSHYIIEEVDGNPKVGKIYDVDLTCTNGQELYEEVCPDGCGMLATRSFVF